MGDPGHRHHHAYEKMQRYDDAFNTHSKNYYDNFRRREVGGGGNDWDEKDGYNGGSKGKHYGESIISEDDIRSEYGHGGKSSFGGGGGRHFSFDDFKKRPGSRHYETKGHSFKYSKEDLYEDDDEDEDDFEIVPREKSSKKKKSKKSSKKHSK